MSLVMPLHMSPLDAHFHWEYQILVLLALAGLWLFLASRGERRQRGHRKDELERPRNQEHV